MKAQQNLKSNLKSVKVSLLQVSLFQSIYFSVFFLKIFNIFKKISQQLVQEHDGWKKTIEFTWKLPKSHQHISVDSGAT